MTTVAFPAEYRLESLERRYPRREFDCGQVDVNDWLRTKAFPNQNKRLSTTTVLLDADGTIAGFYTLAAAQVGFEDLPSELARRLPRRSLPVAVVAWLGVDSRYQKKSLGDRLFAQALCDCYHAGKTFAFVAVVLDCIDDRVKAFYERWDFEELPGNPSRLFLSAQRLAAMMEGRAPRPS